jgi:hypothetical protein
VAFGAGKEKAFACCKKNKNLAISQEHVCL